MLLLNGFLVNQRSAGSGRQSFRGLSPWCCPAATGQDDSGRWRASSVTSTKPLFRIESIRLVVKRYGSPGLFFRGSRYPHLILGFGILRPKAVVRHLQNSLRGARLLDYQSA